MRVTFSPEARDDFARIAERIASAGHVTRAVSFILELKDSCLGLARHAERFQLVERFESHGIRRRVHGNYLIFYCRGPRADCSYPARRDGLRGHPFPEDSAP